MASILDALKSLDLSKGVNLDAVADKVSQASTAATAISSAVGSAQAMGDKLQSEVSDAVAVAKVYVATTVALQAIAAFAALGIFIVQVRQYADIQKARRKTANNPRRRKSRRNARRTR